MKEKIFTGSDRAHEMNFSTYRLFMEFLAKAMNHTPDWSNVDKKHSLNAFVDYGRWLAECECGNAYYVEPDDPLGYCPNCGNMITGGAARPIVFPANRASIEEALLERKLIGDPIVIRNLGTQVALYPKHVHPEVLPRHWEAQTPDELRAEHSKVRDIMQEMKKLKND